MRIIRFTVSDRPRFGILDGSAVRGVKHDPCGKEYPPAGPLQFDATEYGLDEVRLLAPVSPSKIVAVGLNYRSHALETRMEAPSLPLIFLKPPSAVIGPGDDIVLPTGHGRVDYEGELAVVIGRKAKHVLKEEAAEYILGYTCGNDVSERHMQKADGQWARAKGFDTFAPLGPWIETELEPADLGLTTRVNGQVRQSARTSEMIFDIPGLVEFVSGVMTLLPGDVIITGTPAGIGPIHASDIVEVTIEGIGTLTNRVMESELVS